MPVYRRKVRRGFEEMKKSYEDWARIISDKYDNINLRWSY